LPFGVEWNQAGLVFAAEIHFFLPAFEAVLTRPGDACSGDAREFCLARAIRQHVVDAAASGPPRFQGFEPVALPRAFGL